MKRPIALLLGLAACAPAIAAEECAPATMVHIVVAPITVRDGKWASGSTRLTWYRYQSRYGRAEQPRDPSTGDSLVVIANEPDVWTVNLGTGRGKHLEDKGPTFSVHARTFDDDTTASEVIRGIEFGCEINALRKAGAAESTITHEDYGPGVRIEYSEGVERVVLFVPAGELHPKRLELFRDGKAVAALDYIQYDEGLKFDETLFQKPAGVDFEE